MAKVALAYSGRLEGALCIRWLKEERGLKVITFSAGLGQPKYLEPLGEKALEIGADAAIIADLRERFVHDFIFPSLRARAMYESGYYLGTALSRPILVEELAKLAEEEGCQFVAHGCRGIGNDHIRFERCIRAVAPQLMVLAPIEEMALGSPSETIAHAE